MKLRYDERMKTIRDEMERTRRKQVQTIEESKNDHIKRVMSKNQKDFLEIKVYYQEITTANLDSIRRLKEEHAEIKKRENSDAKHMFDLEQRNKQLKEPLKKADLDVERLQGELLAYEEDKKKLA